MNYLLIYPHYSQVYGGIQEIIKAMGNTLASSGNNIYILTKHNYYKNIKHYTEKGLHVHYANLKEIFSLLFKKRINFICLFEPYEFCVMMGFLFKIFRRNIIVDLIFCGSKTEHPGWKIKKLYPLMVKLFDGFIAISQYTKKVAMGTKYQKKIKVIYPPVKINNYKRSSLSNYNLITIGRICPRKNYHSLIESFAIIHKANPKIRLDIIGGLEDNYNDYYQEILKKIKRLSLQDSIFFHLNISEDKKISLLSKAAIYITTSKHEMFGIATVEAMASGLAIVAYDNTATSEVVSSAKGVLVKNNKTDLLSNAVIDLLNDKKKIKIMSKNSLKAAKHFSYENFSKSYKNYFKQQYKSLQIKNIKVLI